MAKKETSETVESGTSGSSAELDETGKSADALSTEASCTTILSSGFFAVPLQANRKASGNRKIFLIGKENFGIRKSFKIAMFPET